MHREAYELIEDHVRAIYRALTGAELPSATASASATVPSAPLPNGVDAAELIWNRFAELDAWSRLLPNVSERVPPFASTPPADVIVQEREVLVELAIPGIVRDELKVDVSGDVLVVSGARRRDRTASGHARQAEIPRGPFRRVILLPQPVGAPPKIEIDNGIVRITFAQSPSVAMA